MTLSELLEDFSGVVVQSSREWNEVAREEERLEAFERGYKAGWEDCTKSQQDSARHISADLSQNLGDLSFTYQEAYTAAMAAIAPVLEQMVHSVLPELAHKSLGVRVVELIQATAQQHGAPRLEIRAAPANLSTIAACLPNAPDIPLDLIEEATLAEGQVHLRFGENTEQEIDMAAVLTGLDDAIAGFFHEFQPHRKEIN